MGLPKKVGDPFHNKKLNKKTGISKHPVVKGSFPKYKV